MRRSDSDFQPYHLIPLKPGEDARARRWNLVIIAILAVLVLGLFTLALVPQRGSNASAASKAQFAR
jgi:hypothetical protein